MIYSEQALVQLNANPLYAAAGIEVLAVADGAARSVLRPQAAMCWPNEGRPHGGVLFTLLDTTMAFAALSNGPTGTGCATVDCNIQYTAPADFGPFECTVASTSKTPRTVFMRGEVKDARGVVVALAQGTFRLFAPRAV